MVSTSRKKNKGQERKAKKVEAEKAERSRVYEDWLGWANGENKVMGKNIQCKHGCDCILPNDLDHPVSSFMHDFITYQNSNSSTEYTTVEMMRDTFQTHGQVWNDNRYREMVVDILTRIGTNMLLMDVMEMVLHKDKGMLWALRIAKTIVVLENYDGGGSLEVVINSRGVTKKMRDLSLIGGISNRRDVLKFFSKRAACLCLKENIKMQGNLNQRRVNAWVVYNRWSVWPCQYVADA